MRRNKRTIDQVIVFLFMVVLFLCTRLAQADIEDFYKSHQTGWHWYNEETIKQKQSEQISEEEKASAIRAEKKTAQEKIERALDEYVMHPTIQSARKYYSLLFALIKHADRVSEAGQQMMLQYPELDYNLIYPSNDIARQIASTEQKAKEDKTITLLGQKVGFFYFYRSNCPYCQKFAPTLKLFADVYHIKIIAITTDGISSPEFQNSYIDQGQADAFQIKILPALFAVSPYSQKAFPIAYGLNSFEDLRRKMLDVFPLVMAERNENNH